LAFCQFNRARLAARKGDFDTALLLFDQALQSLDDGKITRPGVRDEMTKCRAAVKQYMNFEENPTADLHSLQYELLSLQTWYPEYSQQLTNYWWYHRGKEPLSNARISGQSACVIFSDDEHDILWYSEVLRTLFAHCLFAPKESWEDTNTIPQ